MRGAALKQAVVNLFGIVKERSTSEELVFMCPESGCTDKTGNRSVNLKTGKTNCWRCGKGGDFSRWARHLGYRIDGEVVPETTIEAFERQVEKNPVVGLSAPVYALVKLPEGFVRCVDAPKSVYTRLIGDMAQRKHLTLEDFIAAGVGFTRQSKWEPFAIFPVVERGRIIYYQGRTYIDKPDETTKKFPNRHECPVSSKYWVYNIDAVGAPGVTKVVAVESILNCLSLKRKFAELGIADTVPVCVFKHSLSTEQVRKLRMCKNIEELILLFDRDAIEESWRNAAKFADFTTITIAEMPEVPGRPKLDPNDDVDMALAVLAERQPFGVASKVMRNAVFPPTNSDPVSRICFDPTV
jgi:hypothetical protein